MMGAEDFSYFLQKVAPVVHAWPHLCSVSPPHPQLLRTRLPLTVTPTLPPLFLSGTGRFLLPWGNEASLNGWARGGDAAGQRSNCMCHNTAFDFNDNVSPLAAVIFTRLVEERLGVNVYGEDELPVPMLKGLCAEDVGDDGTAMSHAASNVANGPIKLLLPRSRWRSELDASERAPHVVELLPTSHQNDRRGAQDGVSARTHRRQGRRDAIAAYNYLSVQLVCSAECWVLATSGLSTATWGERL